MAYSAAAGQNPPTAALDRHDRGLIEHNSFADQTNERVGRA